MRELSDESVGHQAEAFLAWHERRRGDIIQNFATWSSSKDFSQQDEDAIWNAVMMLAD